MQALESKRSKDLRLEMEAARKKRQPFSVGGKVNVHPFRTETNAVLGKGEILSTSNMGDDFYSVLWRPLIRKKRFYPMAGKHPDMYCTTPCIKVTCEAGSELSLVLDKS
jgi:hypothetical protein